MELIIAVDYLGDFSILKKLYEVDEKNAGLDEWISEIISEFSSDDNSQFGKVFIAELTYTPSVGYFDDGEGDIDIELKKEIFSYVD